jgi:hypothetical protein
VVQGVGEDGGDVWFTLPESKAKRLQAKMAQGMNARAVAQAEVTGHQADMVLDAFTIQRTDIVGDLEPKFEGMKVTKLAPVIEGHLPTGRFVGRGEFGTEIAVEHGPEKLTTARGRTLSPETHVWDGTEKTVESVVTQAMLDKFIGEEGLGELRKARTEQFRTIFRDLMLDEAEFAKGRYVADERKAMRLFRAAQKAKKVGPKGFVDESDLVLLNQVEALFGPEVRDAIGRGQLTKDHWRGLVRKSVESQMGADGSLIDFYEPRNAVNRLGIDGKSIPEDEAVTQMRAGKWRGGTEIRTRTVSDTLWDPNALEDLKRFVRPGSKEEANLQLKLGESKRAFQRALERGEALPVLDLDANRSSFVHIRRSAKDWSMLVDDVSAEELTALREKPWKQEQKGKTPLGRLDAPVGSKDQALSVDEWAGGARPEMLPDGGVTRLDLMDHFVGSGAPAVESSEAEFVREVVMPRLFGEAPLRNLVLWDGIRKTRAVARAVADSKVMKAVESGGGSYGKQFVEGLRTWGSADTRLMEGTSLAGGVSQWLYASHLGLNEGSVVMNMTQPWLLAGSLVGYGNLLKAYPRAFKDMSGYLAERVKFGRKMDPLERRALLKRHLRLTDVDGEDLLGIGDDFLDDLDGVAFSRAAPSREGSAAWWAATSLPMLPFQQAERLNRLVTAYAVEEAHRRRLPSMRFGRGTQAWEGVSEADRFRLKDDIKGLVQRTQFGADLLHQPKLFLTHLDSPILRMFLSFPLRTLTGYLETSQEVGNRGWSGTAVDLLRTLGASALIYEVGKSAMGVDLSRGLGASAVTDIFGGDRFVREREASITLPPAFDVAYGLLRGTALGDAEALRDAAFRLVPGGIALQRAFGTLPDLGPLGGVQKEHADWMNPQADGTVPVFDAQGSLVRFATPGELVARGLGADLGQWRDGQEIAAHLKANRDRMVEYRRAFVQKHLANDAAGAEAVRLEFEKAFGYPLTVTRAQWDQAMRLRTMPMVERIYEQVPRDARARYAPSLQGRQSLLGQGGLSDAELVRRLGLPAKERFEDRPEAPAAPSSFAGFEGF